MRNRLLSLLPFLCLSAFAADPPPRWLEVHSPHFTVMSNSSEKDARHVAAQLERMRAVFHVLLPSASDDAGSPVIVLALKDKKSFRALEPASYLGRNSIDLAGYFLRAGDKNYILLRLDAEGDHPFATVYHEYTHYMLRKCDDWLPLWLNEGLAEFYQNANLQDKDVRVGEPSGDDIVYLRQNKLLPLTTLLTVDHNSPYYHDEEKGSVFYAESWALTHYIEISDKANNTHHLQDYSRFLVQHEDSLTAAQHAFGDLKKLEQALYAYVGQANFQEFKLIAPIAFTDASFDVTPLAVADADATRADILLNVQRPKEAETLLEAVLQADPKNALAHESMGSLKFHENDIPGARKWYADAVQLDSRSYLAHYYFAVMSLQANDHEHDDAIEQSLRTAIKINPRFAPAYDALAEFYASRHERLQEAHNLNVIAVQLEPESLPYRLNTAQVLAEDEQVDNALRVLKEARHLAKSLDETNVVQSRIAQLEHFQAMSKEAETRNSRARSQTADPSGGTVVTAIDVDGTRIGSAAPPAAREPDFPPGAPAGPHRTVSGVIRSVKCIYPTVLTLTLDRPGKPIPLYTNNYFKVVFTTANYNPTTDILPCTAIEGMKAKIDYGEVADPRVSGQILSIELSR